MPAVKNVGEPCAGEPHARFEVAAGRNQTSRASTRRTVQAPLADPTASEIGGSALASTGDTSPLVEQPTVRELLLRALSATDKRLLLKGGTPRHELSGLRVAAAGGDAAPARDPRHAVHPGGVAIAGGVALLLGSARAERRRPSPGRSPDAVRLGVVSASSGPGKTAVAPAVTDAVTTALALGWQMARLYTGPLGSSAEPKLDLPGISDLPTASLVALGLAQADAALGDLKGFLDAGAALPTTEAVRAAVAQEQHASDAIRKAILALHVDLLVDLTAADFRLGKAYGLGRAMADTTGPAPGDDLERKRALEHRLEPHRALVLIGWLDDLKSVLPAHSGQAVADSFERWVRWGEAVNLGALDSKSVSGTLRVLHRCGQRWRAILSGEKAANDLLEIDDYVTAARGALARAGAIARSLAVQLWAPLTLAAVLIGVGIGLMVANNSTAQVIAGLGTVAGGLGVTWRSAATWVGHASLDIARPLWGAQIDAVVGNRLTPLPQRDYVAQMERPKGRVRRAWRELRTAEPDAPRGASSRQASDIERHPSTGTARREADAAATEPLPEPPALGGDPAET